MSKNNFIFHYVIGRGGFGKVILFLFNDQSLIFTISTYINLILLIRFGEWKKRKQDNYMR